MIYLRQLIQYWMEYLMDYFIPKTNWIKDLCKIDRINKNGHELQQNKVKQIKILYDELK